MSIEPVFFASNSNEFSLDDKRQKKKRSTCQIFTPNFKIRHYKKLFRLQRGFMCTKKLTITSEIFIIYLSVIYLDKWGEKQQEKQYSTLTKPTFLWSFVSKQDHRDHLHIGLIYTYIFFRSCLTVHSYPQSQLTQEKWIPTFP